MKLNKLKIKHFKGIKDLEIRDIQGSIAFIGRNGTGKTTALTAITWLLFDKNLDGQTIEPLPVDAQNNVVPGDVEVEVDLTIDNKNINLRRVYKEVFTKKRGVATAVKTGNTSDYFIDDELVKLSDFKEKIISLFGSEELFYILSIPAFFGEKLHWEARRRYLVKLAGGAPVVPDEKMIDKDFYDEAKDLSGDELFAFLSKKKAQYMGRLKKINQELSDLPSRIDELSMLINGVEQVTKEDIGALEAELERLIRQSKGEQASEVKDKITKLKNLSIEKEHEIGRLSLSIYNIKRQESENLKKQLQIADREVSQLQQQIEQLDKGLSSSESKLQTLYDKIKAKQNAVDKARQDYQRVAGQLKEYTPNTICPTCNQELPSDQVENIREAFVSDKTSILSEIQNRGRELASELAELKQEYDSLAGGALDTSERDRLNSLYDKAVEGKNNIVKQIAEVSDSDEIRKISQDIEALRKDKTGILVEIVDLEKQETEPVANNLIEETKEKINALKKQQFEASKEKETQDRINELKIRINKLQSEYEAGEELLFKLESFITLNIDHIEQDINSKFKRVTFKLFEQQINGGIREVCNVLYKGATDLSTGERMATDVDISEMFCKLYNLYPMLLIDNINNLTLTLETDRQMFTALVADSEFRYQRED